MGTSHFNEIFANLYYKYILNKNEKKKKKKKV